MLLGALKEVESVLAIPSEPEVLARLVAWAGEEPSIRAVVMTSTRARPDGPPDLLSDYDIILLVSDPERYGREDGWQAVYGEPMVRWGDQSERLGLTTYFRGVIYTDHVKIDYSIWPDALLERVAEHASLPDQLDVGYRVLLDKDGRTAGWRAPSYRAHIPARPTEAEYRALIEEFWWDTTYVAKSLWRQEVVFAKWCLDYDAKLVALRRMLEWRIELDHDWSLKPGVFGRGFPRTLSAEDFAELAATYTPLETDATWSALLGTVALFRRIAIEVGSALGYVYPQQLDDWVVAYLAEIRALPDASAASSSEDVDGARGGRG